MNTIIEEGLTRALSAAQTVGDDAIESKTQRHIFTKIS
jgi:predicted metalloprotease